MPRGCLLNVALWHDLTFSTGFEYGGIVPASDIPLANILQSVTLSAVEKGRGKRWD